MNPLITNKVLIITTGVSGSGKTTFAEYIESFHPDCVIHSADDYWGEDYNFDVSKLGAAHRFCERNVERSMMNKTAAIICCNTNTSMAERNVYIKMANEYGYEVVNFIMQNLKDTKNIHGVPDETLERQKTKIKNGLQL